jgi:hypothetical protein
LLIDRNGQGLDGFARAVQGKTTTLSQFYKTFLAPDFKIGIHLGVYWSTFLAWQLKPLRTRSEERSSTLDFLPMKTIAFSPGSKQNRSKMNNGSLMLVKYFVVLTVGADF